MADNPFSKYTTPTVEVTPTSGEENPFLKYSQPSVESAIPVETTPITEQVNPLNSPLFQKFTTPSGDVQEFNPANVAISTGLGVGGGFLFGGPYGAALGGTSGLVSGIAEEYARSTGESPAVQLLAGIGGGALSDLGLKFGAKTVGVFLPKILGFDKTLENDFVKNKIALKSKEKVFGKPTFAGMATTETSDALKNDLMQRTGIIASESEKVSDVVRKGLYQDLKTTTPFGRSPEYRELMDEITILKRRNPGYATDAQIKNMNQVIDNEVFPNPKVQEPWAQDMLNLVQNRGKYSGDSAKDVKELITPEMQSVLKDKFNKFLEKNAKGKSYNYLKDIERQEFIAEAKDSIPTILNTGFRPGTEAFDSAVDTLKYTDEGKALFANAVKQHFYNMGKVAGELPASVKVSPISKAKEVGLNVDSSKMITELNRIQKALKDTGLMPIETYQKLRADIAKIPKEVAANQRTQLVGELIGNAIIVPTATQAFSF
jgi:RNA-binding protein YhbY